MKYFELDSKIELPAFQARSVSGYLPEVGEIYPISCPLILSPPSFQVPFQTGMGGEEGWERSYSIHIIKRRLRCSPSKDLKLTLLGRWLHVFSPKITGELSPVINAGCLGLLPRPLEIWRLTLQILPSTRLSWTTISEPPLHLLHGKHPLPWQMSDTQCALRVTNWEQPDL